MERATSHALDVVNEAIERTLESRTAQVEFTLDHRLTTRGPSNGRRGVLSRLARRAGIDPRHQVATGVVDLVDRRAVVAFPGVGLLVEADRQFKGRSGRPISEVPDEPSDFLQPLWLFDLVHGGVQSASMESQRRIAAVANFHRAAKATGHLALPPVAAYEDLDALRLDLALDDGGRIVCISHDAGSVAMTLKLRNFGAAMGERPTVMP